MNDTIYRGTIAGIFGGLGDEVIHALGYFIFGLTMTEHYISQLIFPTMDVTIVRFIFAFFIHFMASAIIGVVLSYIFKFTGYDYPYIKGIVVGSFSFIVHVAIIPNLVSPRPYLFRTDLEMLFDLIAHTAFSIVAVMYLIFSKNRTAARYN